LKIKQWLIILSFRKGLGLGETGANIKHTFNQKQTNSINKKSNKRYTQISMKKLKLFFAGAIALVLFAGAAKAQSTTGTATATATTTDPFAGKWDILVKGLPNGDTHMMFTLAAAADGKLGGSIKGTDGPDIPITKSDKDDKGVTLYFTAQGYDVSMTLQKTDDDHVKGSLMNMFDCTGERVKQ
jgi:hypothetical protein